MGTIHFDLCCSLQDTWSRASWSRTHLSWRSATWALLFLNWTCVPCCPRTSSTSALTSTRRWSGSTAFCIWPAWARPWTAWRRVPPTQTPSASPSSCSTSLSWSTGTPACTLHYPNTLGWGPTAGCTLTPVGPCSTPCGGSTSTASGSPLRSSPRWGTRRCQTEKRSTCSWLPTCSSPCWSLRRSWGTWGTSSQI